MFRALRRQTAQRYYQFQEDILVRYSVCGDSSGVVSFARHSVIGALHDEHGAVGVGKDRRAVRAH